MKEIRLCGVRIDNVTREAAVERAMEYTTTEMGETCVVFTPNATMLDACRREGRLAEVLEHATLSLPDGAGVVMAARRAGSPLRERVAGIEFGEMILERAAKEGRRVFLLGGGEGVAETAAVRLRKRYDGLCVCGSFWGYFDRAGEENRQVLELIRKSGTEILFVCMGFPVQEEWIVENRAHLANLRVVAALGGSLDVWSGKTKRAPKVLSKMGLEWAWRMAREPKRLKHLPAIVRSVFLKSKPQF